MFAQHRYFSFNYFLSFIVLGFLLSISSVRADLVGHWWLSEGVGNQFVNSGEPIDGQPEDFDGFLPAGSNVTWAPVVLNADGTGPTQEMAPMFDGASWIETNFPGVGGNDPRTVTAWIKLQPGTVIGDILGYGVAANSLKWHFRINSSAANGVVGAIRTEYQGGQNVGTDVINDGDWYHVAAVFPEGALNGQEINHYVNGVLQGKSGGDRAITTDIGDTAARVTIGRTMQGVTPRWFIGQIADVRIYDEELTDEDLLSIMEEEAPPPVELEPCTSLSMTCEVDPDANQVIANIVTEPEGCDCGSVEVTIGDGDPQIFGVSPSGITLRLDEVCRLTPGETVTVTARCFETELTAQCEVACPDRQGLVAHWPLNEGGGIDFEDLVGGNDGTLVPADEFLIEHVEGPPGLDGAVQFNGTSGIETIFKGIAGANPRTVSFWAKTTDLANHGIIGWGDSTATGAKYHIRINNVAGNGPVGALRTEYQDGQHVATTSVVDDQWHHFASVLPDGVTNGHGILHYVDGFNDPYGGGGDQELNTVIGGPRQLLTIGKRFQGVDTVFFTGAIADVRIYDTALSEEEILELALNGRCAVRRTLDVNRFSPGDEITVNIKAVNISGPTTITETFPLGLTVVNAGGGSVEGNEIEFTVTENSEISYTLGTTDFCDQITIVGSYSDGAECEGEVFGGSIPTCVQGCSDLQANGSPRSMLILGPIAAGLNTGPQCDDNGNLGITDYLVGAAGEHSEEDIDVVFGEEISPDFGNLAGGAGVADSPNQAINPNRADGVLTAWIAEVAQGGIINFNLPENLGDPLDDYIIYSLVYLQNTTGGELPVTLRVGSDDAVKVLLNGEQVHLNPVCRGTPSEDLADRVPVTLLDGMNTVLIAVVERGGGNGVRLHVYDELDVEPLVDGSVRACLASDNDDPPPPPKDVFKRGDSDGNGALEITDPINSLAFQFLGTFTPPCMDAADFDDNGLVEITDPIANLSHQFLGTTPPAPPGKETCGEDPTEDDLDCLDYLEANCAP